MQSIYYAEDNESTRLLVSSFLKAAGYIVKAFQTADELLVAFNRNVPDLIILDIIMNGTDGIPALTHIRASSKVPIIFLTAKSDDIDICSGLMLGSDDYLTKPFNPLVLVSHVRALLRRVEYGSDSGCPNNRHLCIHGNTKFDFSNNSIYIDDELLPITPTERRLLAFFMCHYDETLSRADILSAVWNLPSGIESRTLDETCRRMRVKLAKAESDIYIQTIRGFGFRMTGVQ